MLGVLGFIALAGIFNLLGVPGFEKGDGGKNLEWNNLWAGSRLEANGFVIGLYNVIWYARDYSEVYRSFNFYPGLLLAIRMRIMPSLKFVTQCGHSRGRHHSQSS